MSYQNILVGEISSIVDELMERKLIVNPQNVTQTICNHHTHEIIDDAPFSTFNIYSNVRREVRKVISAKTNDDMTKESSQLTIEGFEHLQKYYSIKRDDEYLGVPIDQLTPDEVKDKCNEYRKMSRALAKHADELEFYYENKLA